MPFDCQHRLRHGPEVCLTDCLSASERGGCRFVRVERAGDLPPAVPWLIDVAVLDMHHGWPNLGHDAIVHAVQNAVCDLQADLEAAGLGFRVISYDVRRGHQIPEPPGGRHAVYIGTGGPGHLDPRRNDGVSPGSQGIVEDPAWEAPLFGLFDAIERDEHAALLAVCHTFGVLCRWLGVADAVLRGPGKGGKSTGIVDNILTPEAAAHPWFSQFAAELADRRRFRILDSRLYDLIPTEPLPARVTAVAHETLGHDGPRGPALTMIEVARDPDGVIPRMLAVNHHPEIVNRPRQLTLLRKKMERHNLSAEWLQERAAALTQTIDAHGDRSLHLTASYTLLAPLRHHLHRVAHRRALEVGRPLDRDIRLRPIVYRPAADCLQPDRRE